jgi:hypothetical protein
MIICLFGFGLFFGTGSAAWSQDMQGMEMKHENAGESEGAKVKIPDTAREILASVLQHEAALARIIAGKELNKVHEAAFAIRDLVDALPAKSSDLPAEKREKVKGNAKYVAILAGRLDESGDSNDQAATEANFRKFQDIIKIIIAQYPADMVH